MHRQALGLQASRQALALAVTAAQVSRGSMAAAEATAAMARMMAENFILTIGVGSGARVSGRDDEAGGGERQEDGFATIWHVLYVLPSNRLRKGGELPRCHGAH